MASYLTLPIETDPDTIAEAILDYLVANIPGFIPVDGDLTSWFASAVAQQIATNRDTATLVTDTIFRTYGQSLIGLTPLAGAKATAPSTWTMTDSAGYTIHAGTLVGLTIAGDQVAVFQVQADVIVAPGASVTGAGAVILEAVNEGVANNGIAAGAATLIQTLAYVAGVATTAISTGGADAETDAAYLDRLVEELKLLSPRPIHPADFGVLARKIAGVGRALGIDLYSPGRTVADAGITNASPTLTSASAAFTADDVGRTAVHANIPGGATILAYVNPTTVTLSANATATLAAQMVVFGALSNKARAVAVAAVTAGGAALAGGIKTTLLAYLQAQREVNFLVSVIDPTFTAVNVAFSFQTAAGYSPAAVKTASEAAVRAFISPATFAGGANTPPTWDSGNTVVRRLDVSGVIYSVPGILHITALTLNGGTADVNLAGTAPLPDAASTVVGTAV